MIGNCSKTLHLHPQTVINVRHDKKEEQRVPLHLCIFFLSIQVICGYNFGFHKLFPRLTKNCIMTVSFISFIIMSVLQISALFILIHLHLKNNVTYNISKDYIAALVWHMIQIIQFLISYFFMLFSHYKVYDFVRDIYEVCEIVNKNAKCRMEVYAFMFTLMLFFIELGCTYASCSSDLNPCVEYSFFGLPIFFYVLSPLALYTTSASQILIFLYVQQFLLDIKILLKKEKISLLEAQKYYTEFVRCCEKITPLNDKLIILMLLTATPKLMGSIWYALSTFKAKNGGTESIFLHVFTVNILLQICLPSAIVQIVGIRAKAFKMMLYDKLIDDKDEVTTVEVNRLLQYVKASSLVNDLWGIVPIDLRLPVSMCSFCVTYIIFLIQVTHLFD